MRYLVIYYSRSGKVKRLATKISSVKNAHLEKLEDHKDWKGFFGFMMAGFYATFKKGVPIDPLTVSLRDYDQIYLLTPIWAGSIPPAVRSFKKTLEGYNGHLTVVYSCQSTSHQNYKNMIHKEFPSSTVMGFSEKHQEQIDTTEL